MRLISSRALVVAASCLVLGGAFACGGGDAELDPGTSVAEPAPAAAPSAVPSATSMHPSDREMANVMAGAIAGDLPLEMRVFATQQLGSLAPAVSIGPIVKAFGDPESAVVLAAIEALPKTDDKAALDGLRGLSLHPDSKVQSAAGRKLASLE